MQLARGIHPPLRDQTRIGVPDLRLHHCVEAPPVGVVDIEIGRDDVEVSGEHMTLGGVAEFFRVRNEPLEPAKLVVEIRRRHRIAVREIDRCDDETPNSRLEVARLRVRGIPR